MIAEGLDDMIALKPETGVMFVANHRSFFDQLLHAARCYMGLWPWAKSLHFPVRSNFFYDQPLGVLINAAIAGGAMYPPIYARPNGARSTMTRSTRMVEILSQPGNILGMHPEGTRGKGPIPTRCCRRSGRGQRSRCSAARSWSLRSSSGWATTCSMTSS